jgi:hypothetical protein
MNSKLTCGSYDDMSESAMWPRPGMPRGTHWLAHCSFVKIYGYPLELNQRNIIREIVLAGSGLPTRPPLELVSGMVLLIYKFAHVEKRRKKGWGLDPAPNETYHMAPPYIHTQH